MNEKYIEITSSNLGSVIGHLLTDPYFSCDTETYGLGWGEGAFLVGFGHADGTAYWIRETSPYFKDATAEIVSATTASAPAFANAKFDQHRLEWLVGRTYPRVNDVIVLSQLLFPEHRVHKLKVIGERQYGEAASQAENELEAWLDQHNCGRKEYWKVPEDIMSRYFYQDLMLTRKLFDIYYPLLEKYPKLGQVYDTEMRLNVYVQKMEKRGIVVDREYLQHFQAELVNESEALDVELRKKFDVGADFNFNSDEQLADLLYTRLGFPVTHRTFKTQAPSTNEAALNEIKHPGIEYLKQYQLYNTYLSKFINPWLEFSKADGLLHANFKQTGTVSGRFSCEEPNLQQLMKDPKILRGLLVRPGYVMGSSDLSQIELVGAAWYTKDPRMLSAVRRGVDLHRETASIIYDKAPESITAFERGIGKGMNFSVIYGCGKAKLAAFIKTYAGIDITQAQAAEARERYLSKFPTIKQFSYKVSDTIKRRPDRVIRNWFGRRYYLAPEKEYIGINRLIQGWAADLVKKSMVGLGDKLDWEKRLIVTQVHDSVGWECPVEEAGEMQALVEHEMTHWPEFDVPIKVKTKLAKTDWSELSD